MIRKKLLITGGLGFAGKHFYKSQFNKWKKIVIYDKMTYAADRAFINRYFDKKKDKIVIGDILDKRKLEKVELLLFRRQQLMYFLKTHF